MDSTSVKRPTSSSDTDDHRDDGQVQAVKKARMVPLQVNDLDKPIDLAVKARVSEEVGSFREIGLPEDTEMKKVTLLKEVELSEKVKETESPEKPAHNVLESTGAKKGNTEAPQEVHQDREGVLPVATSRPGPGPPCSGPDYLWLVR